MLYQYNKNTLWTGAVCFILIEDKVLLIQRSKTMPTHAGQVGFIGGHRQKGEEHPFETIYREFVEETHLDSDLLNDMTLLEPVKTSNLKTLMPVICRVEISPATFLNKIKSNGEWDNAYLVDFDYLKDPNNWSKGVMHNKKKYDIYFCPIPKEASFRKFSGDDKKIILWGATAKIIWNFFKKHHDDVNFS